MFSEKDTGILGKRENSECSRWESNLRSSDWHFIFHLNRQAYICAYWQIFEKPRAPFRDSRGRAFTLVHVFTRRVRVTRNTGLSQNNRLPAVLGIFIVLFPILFYSKYLLNTPQVFQ